MARGGGGGGHSSFGGGFHSGGHSSFGGSFGGSRSSFGGSRSGGYSGGSHYSGPHHYGGYGGGYYSRPPRRYYGSGRSTASSGCTIFFIIVFIIFAVIGSAINSCQMAMSGMSCASSGQVTNSTEKREKMSTANTTYCNQWYEDELGWFSHRGTLVDGLESFYQKTGVQPFVYMYRYDETNAYNNANVAHAKAEEIYHAIFGEDEGHLLFVYFACPNDYPSLMEGRYEVICGKQTEVVMDENAKDILNSRLNYYYDDTSLEVDEFIAKAFKTSGKAIMSGPIRKRTVVLILAGIIGFIVVMLIGFKWWKAKKAQKNKENEDLEKILSTPLESFGSSDVDDLKGKYDDK